MKFQTIFGPEASSLVFPLLLRSLLLDLEGFLVQNRRFHRAGFENEGALISLFSFGSIR